MLRVTIELLPDNNQLEKNFGKPKLLKVIDIKEDGTGSFWYGNYKSRFYDTLGTEHAAWRRHQVSRMLYKDYYPELLLYLILKNWITDTYRNKRHFRNRNDWTMTPIDYPEWKLKRFGDLEVPVKWSTN